MKRVIFAVLFLLIVFQFSFIPNLNASKPKPDHEPMFALIFGLIIPGGAQFYNGDIQQAIMNFLIVVGLCIALIIIGFFVPFLFFISWIPWLLGLYFMWQGYQKAIKIRDGTVMRLDRTKLADLRLNNKAYAF
ncbi:hypothetical protein KAU43_09080 [candidate division WOR-3 bacterium]|nr:hypothetical protein [candidate division WOR-3 bacterium]